MPCEPQGGLLCFARPVPEARSYVEHMRGMEDLGDALEPLRFRNPHWAEELANLLKKAGGHLK